MDFSIELITLELLVGFVVILNFGWVTRSTGSTKAGVKKRESRLKVGTTPRLQFGTSSVSVGRGLLSAKLWTTPM
jgi:hypothetical protein